MDALETRNASKVLISSFFPSNLDLPSVARGRPNGIPAALTAAKASLVRRDSKVRSISAKRMALALHVVLSPLSPLASFSRRCALGHHRMVTGSMRCGLAFPTLCTR
jgi:hypothetical protein